MLFMHCYAGVHRVYAFKMGTQPVLWDMKAHCALFVLQVMPCSQESAESVAAWVSGPKS
jgi:hypothetical protein